MTPTGVGNPSDEVWADVHGDFPGSVPAYATPPTAGAPPVYSPTILEAGHAEPYVLAFGGSSLTFNVDGAAVTMLNTATMGASMLAADVVAAVTLSGPGSAGLTLVDAAGTLRLVGPANTTLNAFADVNGFGMLAALGWTTATVANPTVVTPAVAASEGDNWIRPCHGGYGARWVERDNVIR